MCITLKPQRKRESFDSKFPRSCNSHIIVRRRNEFNGKKHVDVISEFFKITCTCAFAKAVVKYFLYPTVMKTNSPTQNAGCECNEQNEIMTVMFLAKNH